MARPPLVLTSAATPHLHTHDTNDSITTAWNAAAMRGSITVDAHAAGTVLCSPLRHNRFDGLDTASSDRHRCPERKQLRRRVEADPFRACKHSVAAVAVTATASSRPQA